MGEVRTTFQNRQGEVLLPRTVSDIVFRPDGSNAEEAFRKLESHVFDDTMHERTFYPTLDGLLWYIDDEYRLCHFNEETFEVKRYDAIHAVSHSYWRNANPSCKRFIIRDGKALVFKTNSDALRLYDIATGSLIYESVPLTSGNTIWHSGFFVEYNGSLFIFNMFTCGCTKIDFETGEVLKEYSFFIDNNITPQRYVTYFSYSGDGFSLFCINGKIIKYDYASDDFSLLIDTGVSSDNVNCSKGVALSLSVSTRQPEWLFVFTRMGLSVQPVGDILSGKYDSSKNFVPYYGISSHWLPENMQFAHFGANIYRNYQMVLYTNMPHNYSHTTGFTIDSDPDERGLFVKGRDGYILLRYSEDYSQNTNFPIYRRYNNDIH